MTSLLRIIPNTVNFYARSHPNHILLQSRTRLFQTEVAKQLTKFTDKRKQYVKTGIEFNDLVYSGKGETDIKKLLKWLKSKNKYIMDPDKSWKREFVSSSVFKFLYAIQKPDKSLEIFNNKEFESLFMNLQCIQILLSHLLEQKRNEAAVQVFERYLDQLPIQQNSTEAADKETKPIYYGSLFEIVDVIFKTLHNMGTIDALQKMNEIEETLKTKHGKFLPAASAIRIVLQSVQQKKIDLMHDKIAKYSDGILSPLVKRNLLVIVKAESSRPNEAFDELEKLINYKSGTNLIIFPDTLKHIRNSLDKEVNTDHKTQHEERLEKILAICTKKDLIKTITLEEFVEKKMVRQKRPAPKDTSSKGVDPVPEKKPQGKVVTSKQTQIDKTIYASIQSLYAESKFNEIATLVEEYQKSDEFLRGLSTANLSLITSAFFLTNTSTTFEQMKQLLDTCVQKGIVLHENSRLQAFLMACFHREPNYALGIAVMTGISEMSPTLFKNLKVIAYSEYGNFDKALYELNDILKLDLNIFANEGFAYRSAVDYLEQATKKSNDTDLTERFSSLKARLLEEGRIPRIDLSDFCSTSVENKKITREFLVKQVTGRNFTQTTGDIDRRAEELVSEYMREGKRDYSDLSKKAKILVKQLSRNPGVWKELEGLTRFRISQVVADSIRNDPSLDLKSIRGMLEPLERLNVDLSSGANVYLLLDIFLRLIQLDPIYALDFINTHGRLQQEHPGLFANILCIGLSLLDTVDLALSQMETILTIESTTKKTKRFHMLRFEGKAFPMAINLLGDAVERSADPKHSAQFKDLLTKIKEGKRMSTVDLPSFSSRK